MDRIATIADLLMEVNEMTERQKQLVCDYGPRFYRRSLDIQTEFLHLSADAASVLTDPEWSECAEAITKVIAELKKANEIVHNRMKEAGLPVR